MCKIRVTLASSYLPNSSWFKDRMPFNICSNVCYKFTYGGWNATCICETSKHFNVRVDENSDFSVLVWKKSKTKTITVM